MTQTATLLGPVIGCLFAGHEPSQDFEFSRAGTRRLTYCVRCGQGVTHVVAADFPIPPTAISTEEENEDRFIAKFIARLAAKAPAKRTRKP